MSRLQRQGFLIAAMAVLILLGACSTTPKRDLALERVRSALEELKKWMP